LVGGALLGAALASVPGVAWANDCRRLGRECRRASQCCSRNCVRRGDDKVCGCPEDQTRCNDRCVNLKTNERHCGACGNSCPEGSECVRGECQGQGRCPPGTTECTRTVGEGSTDPQCVPDCPPGQVLNTKRCECIVPTPGGGTNVGCICRNPFDGNNFERYACFSSPTCPDFRDDFCRQVCESAVQGATLVNTSCTQDDIC
jgi:hypothetical protein